MKIASLQPFATDVLARCGIATDLVAVTQLCEVPKSCGRVTVVTKGRTEPLTYADENEKKLAQGLSLLPLDLKLLLSANPDVIIADVQSIEVNDFVAWAESYLDDSCRRKVKILNVAIHNLSEMSAVIEELGGLAGNRAEARILARKTQAQLMAWADSFFERCKGKRVVVLSSTNPPMVVERWFPDLVRLLGAKSLERSSAQQHTPITWEDIVRARPDVIIVAPEGLDLAASIKTFQTLQELPHWDDLPAVKRGEVIFCAGIDMYRPGPRFLKGAAILVSAVAGLDSGYITERDSYYKVRYLELHRHRFL